MKKTAVLAAIGLLLASALWAQGLSLRDSLGRTVSLGAPARRIVSLTPSATEILFEIGAGDRVAGVTDYCNWPGEAATRPRVGGYSAESISLERVLALRPDLVVSGGPVHASLRVSLERFGLGVYVFEPNGVEETFKGMEDLGRLTGNDEGAAALVREVRKGFAEVSERTASIPEASRVRVFWEAFPEPLITCGGGSFLNELIARAGGVNVFGDLKASWPVVSSEEVVRRAPQVILAAEDHGPGLGAEELAKRPGWSVIPAVREGRIRFLPADPVNRTGPRMAQGAALIARALYPELFP